MKYVTICQNSGSISREYKLPPKKTIGVITKEGITDICSKFVLIKPIKKPNKANVKATSTNKKIIKNGYITETSTKKFEVIKITIQKCKIKTMSDIKLNMIKVFYIKINFLEIW